METRRKISQEPRDKTTNTVAGSLDFLFSSFLPNLEVKKLAMSSDPSPTPQNVLPLFFSQTNKKGEAQQDKKRFKTVTTYYKQILWEKL